MKEEALAYESVTIRYAPDGAPVVDSVTLTLKAGERAALIGLNGSGKTTLLTATAGLVPHEGEIRVCGIRLDKSSIADVRGRLGLLFNVPEDQLLLPRVIDDVAFGLVRRGMPMKEAEPRAMNILDELQVAHLAKLPLHNLSHGQKLRVALAGVLVTEPELLLLDEPSAGLDPPGRRRLSEYLDGLGSTMLVATHDLEFAKSFCRRFVLLESGRFVMDGPEPDRVSSYWKDPPSRQV
ncbi:MAG: ABC transporter ATP-binding protein [Pseudomonadota bacterium]